VGTLNKILYVEDQKDIQMIAEYALTTIANYTVKICSSGNEALAEIETFSPDLLLLDVMMPGLDGPETLQEIRKLASYKNTPAIYMTAKILPNEIDDLMSQGAIAIISKPFDPVTLGGEIQALWDKASAASDINND
jgi:two-component system, OmpR family, response regulator